MVIRKGIQEEKDSDVSCFVLVNNLNNELTRSCSSFTKQELGYLKLLVENVVMSDNGEIGIMAALALGPERQPRLKATLVENLIDRLVEEKWLIRGYTCPACDTKGHRNCLENFWKRSNCTNQCAVSSCGAKWEDSTSTKNKRRRTISEDY
ncbi:Non-structural maintenance of chromosomes element 1-like protein [Armadillidium vulgare]|nr:Non-structural maintenance of chromosomes element 1-like protein [Armadillidium vulgare]